MFEIRFARNREQKSDYALKSASDIRFANGVISHMLGSNEAHLEIDRHEHLIDFAREQVHFGSITKQFV